MFSVTICYRHCRSTGPMSGSPSCWARSHPVVNIAVGSWPLVRCSRWCRQSSHFRPRRRKPKLLTMKAPYYNRGLCDLHRCTLQLSSLAYVWGCNGWCLYAAKQSFSNWGVVFAVLLVTSLAGWGVEDCWCCWASWWKLWSMGFRDYSQSFAYPTSIWTTTGNKISGVRSAVFTPSELPTCCIPDN
jgi:hypothetical protein